MRVQPVAGDIPSLIPFGSADHKKPANTPRFADNGRHDAPGAGQSEETIDFVEVREGVLSIPSSNGHEHGALRSTQFQEKGWLEAWQGLIGEELGSKPFTAIGYSAGKPVFILPLTVIRRYGSRVLTWSAYQQSDYNAPVVSTAHAAALANLDGGDILRDIARRVGKIDLVYMPKQPRFVGGIANPFLLPGAVPYHAGAHAINFLPGETWEAAFRRRRSAKTRRRLREKRLALEKAGTVSLRIAATQSEAKGLIGLCLDAKSRQLQKLGHWDPFADLAVREFVISVFSNGADRSTWVAALDAGDGPAAVAFGFRNSSEWLLYQMAMTGETDPRHSPGTHLLIELMSKCSELGVRRLDLALGDEPYKAEWCDEHHVLETSTLAFTARGWLLQTMIRFRAMARSRLAADPRLYERAKWLKGIARKFRLPF